MVENTIGATYRVTTDFWGDWGAVLKSHAQAVAFQDLIGVNNTFIDLDMMPYGDIKVNRYPPRGHEWTDGSVSNTMTLYVITKSMLMFGGNLPIRDDDATTRKYVMNSAAYEIHQRVLRPRFRNFTTNITMNSGAKFSKNTTFSSDIRVSVWNSSILLRPNSTLRKNMMRLTSSKRNHTGGVHNSEIKTRNNGRFESRVNVASVTSLVLHEVIAVFNLNRTLSNITVNVDVPQGYDAYFDVWENENYTVEERAHTLRVKLCSQCAKLFLMHRLG